MDALLGMLAPDVMFHGDGGGKAQAIGQPMTGRQQVTQFLSDCSAGAGRWGFTFGWPGSTGSRGRCFTTRRGA